MGLISFKRALVYTAVAWLLASGVMTTLIYWDSRGTIVLDNLRVPNREEYVRQTDNGNFPIGGPRELQEYEAAVLRSSLPAGVFCGFWPASSILGLWLLIWLLTWWGSGRVVGPDEDPPLADDA